LAFEAGDTVLPRVDGEEKGKEGEDEEKDAHGEETCSSKKKGEEREKR